MRLLLAGLALLTAELPADVLDVSETLAAIREKHDVPALAAVAIVGERVVASGAAGVRKRGTEAKVTLDDRFHLGSCTKSMTATMLATLVEEGKLSWSTTIGDVFGDLGQEMRPEWKSVTLEQLLTHRSGAPGDVPRDLWSQAWKRQGRPSAQRMDLVRGTLADEPEEEPGTKFVYSNTGYAIAGAMAEKVTGKEWEDLMQKRLFEPLGMSSAGFGAPGKKGKLDEPLGHKGDGTPRELGPGDDNPPAIGPAGSVHATLGDWAKYVAAHLTRSTKLLKPETYAKLHAPAEGKDKEYAMGWGVLEQDWGGGPVLTHNGSNTMWYCLVKMAPRKDFAVLVATNQGRDAGAKACDEAATALIDVALARRESEKK